MYINVGMANRKKQPKQERDDIATLHTHCHPYMFLHLKGAGGCGGLDVWGSYKSGSDVAVGCLAEALLWCF